MDDSQPGDQQGKCELAGQDTRSNLVLTPPAPLNTQLKSSPGLARLLNQTPGITTIPTTVVVYPHLKSVTVV